MTSYICWQNMTWWNWQGQILTIIIHNHHFYKAKTSKHVNHPFAPQWHNNNRCASSGDGLQVKFQDWFKNIKALPRYAHTISLPMTSSFENPSDSSCETCECNLWQIWGLVYKICGLWKILQFSIKSNMVATSINWILSLGSTVQKLQAKNVVVRIQPNWTILYQSTKLK